jgi:hypothetical protein
MFYYIELHLLAHYIQLIKMHGETVKWTYDIWVQVGSVWKCIILMLTVKQVKSEYPNTKTGYVLYWWCTIFLILQYIEEEENCIQRFGVEYSGKETIWKTKK